MAAVQTVASTACQDTLLQLQADELAAAEASLLPAVTDPIMSNMEYFAQIAFALASVYEAQGQSGKARAISRAQPGGAVRLFVDLGPQIACQLHIAPATVKRHAESIYGKLGVRGRREAVAKASGLGILSAG